MFDWLCVGMIVFGYCFWFELHVLVSVVCEFYVYCVFD